MMPGDSLDEELIRKTVLQTLLELGLNVADPKDVIELQKDFQHVRRERVAFETLGLKGVAFILTTAIGGAFAAFIVGVQAFLKHN